MPGTNPERIPEGPLESFLDPRAARVVRETIQAYLVDEDLPEDLPLSELIKLASNRRKWIMITGALRENEEMQRNGNFRKLQAYVEQRRIVDMTLQQLSAQELDAASDATAWSILKAQKEGRKFSFMPFVFPAIFAATGNWSALGVSGAYTGASLLEQKLGDPEKDNPLLKHEQQVQKTVVERLRQMTPEEWNALQNAVTAERQSQDYDRYKTSGMAFLQAGLIPYALKFWGPFGTALTALLAVSDYRFRRFFKGPTDAVKNFWARLTGKEVPDQAPERDQQDVVNEYLSTIKTLSPEETRALKDSIVQKLDTRSEKAFKLSGTPLLSLGMIPLSFFLWGAPAALVSGAFTVFDPRFQTMVKKGFTGATHAVKEWWARLTGSKKEEVPGAEPALQTQAP